MNRYLAFILSILIMTSCSEPFDLDTASQDKTYLCLEALLTDIPSVQTIRLTESISYLSDDTVPCVGGATVTVTDGTETFLFSEGDAGYYYSVPDFHCEIGKTYTLSIECRLSDGTQGSYTASSFMPDNGFEIERIDYKQIEEPEDSTWVLGIWGKDKPETSYYMVTTAVNGVMSPPTSNLDRAMLFMDTYFNNSTMEGYLAGYLYQNSSQYRKYGACAKVPETGDVLSLVMYTIPKGFYDFMPSMSSSSGGLSIPLIGSQPANLPTNISGGNAVGYFATCPIAIESCVVDDPSRRQFN